MHKRKKTKKPNKAVLVFLIVLLVLAGAGAILLVMKRQAPVQSSPSAAIPAEAGPSETSILQVADDPKATPVPDPDAGAVLISEVMGKNRASLRSVDGNFYDWIELKNTADHSVSLAGWRLSDKGMRDGFVFPDVSIPAGGYLLVFASGKEQRSPEELHAGFSLSAGETLILSTAAGNLSSQLVCPENKADISLALTENGTYAECRYPSPGLDNTIESYLSLQEQFSVAGPLVINEVSTSNRSLLYSRERDEYPDWIELKNISSAPVELSRYYLTDRYDELRQFQLPAGTLAPGAVILVLGFEQGATSYSGNTIVSSFRLDGENDRLFISDGSALSDYASIKDIPNGGSFGRMRGENGFFYFTTPSPGAENENGVRYVCAKPETDIPDGLYEGIDSLQVTLSGAGTIYYTTDGSLPTHESTRYSGPLTLESTCVIRAICSDGAGIDSRPMTASFFLNEGHTLPVLSVVADDAKELERIYRQGIKGLELAGAIEFFEDGESFSIDCGVKMAGRASLGRPKKNLSFRFRGAYGESRLDYDLFDGGIASFSALTLRSGHDSDKGVIRNEISEDLCLACTDIVAAQRSKWVVMYMNGQYCGVYALKDKVNRQFIADLEGIPKETVEIEEDPTILSTEFYKTVIFYCVNNDMTVPANYEHLCSLLDIESFIDWIIVEQYTGNFDILYGNTAFYRSPELDGNRWKAIFFDLDAAFRYDYYNFRNFFNIDYQLNYYAQMLRALLLNPEFRDRYVTRVAEMLDGPLSNEAVVQRMEDMYSLIDEEMKRDCVRWEISYQNYLNCRNELINMITASDYEKHSMETVAQWTSLTDEERIAYFGK